jgi:hypothetical protein
VMDHRAQERAPNIGECKAGDLRRRGANEGRCNPTPAVPLRACREAS